MDDTPSWAVTNDVPVWANSATAGIRKPAATGIIGNIGQTFKDLTTPGPITHEPNALEEGLMKMRNSMHGVYMGAAANDIIAQPTRAVLEGLNVGRKPGETNEQFHQRYNQALSDVRQESHQEVQNNKIKNPVGRKVQQTLNFGAGVAGTPEYLAIPGVGGVGGNIVTRVATAGAYNAAISGVADAAAQGLDMAEGMQKDFDIQRNLESAGMGGVLGAGFHGAIEVSPFVKDLFAKRGVDTTPSADPRVSKISPMTKDHVAMNTADAMQYQQLLQTGSVDDIKAFFEGRNGPQPSWQEVNDWVQHRDTPAVSTNGQPGPDVTRQPEFDYATEYNNYMENQWKDQNRNAVTEHVNNQIADWKNAPEIEIVHGPEDISDPVIREKTIKDDPNGESLGFVGPDGKVRMFSGRITSPEMANAVLYHEGLGHFGLAQKFGERLDQVLGTLLDRNVNQFSKLTDAWIKKNPGAYGGNRIRAAEEVLAEASQNGQVKSSWQNALTAAVRQFGRKMGLKLGYSDGEVMHILAMAHDAVINGTRSAVENGFKGSSKFMYVKPGLWDHLAGRKEFVGRDGHRRVEISDHEATIAPDWADKPKGSGFDFNNSSERYPLGDVLDHPELYKRYPELKNLPVTKRPAVFDVFGSTQGWFDDVTKELNITPYAKNPLTTALHEVQHVIQDKHGWSSGGNPGTIPLHDMEALNKLKAFTQRKLDEGGLNPFQEADAKNLIKDVETLIENNESAKFAYEHVDDINTKIDKLRQKIKDFEVEFKKQRAASKNWEDYGYFYDNEHYQELEGQLEDLQADRKQAEDNLSRLKNIYQEVSKGLYHLIAGEVEARDTQIRRVLPPSARALHPPYSIEGIKDSEVIHVDRSSSQSDNKYMHDGFSSLDQEKHNSDIARDLNENKFVTREQLNQPEDRPTSSGNFEILHSKGALGEPFIHLKPTEKLMPSPEFDAYDRGQAGIKAFLHPNHGWIALNSYLPDIARGNGREMYRELNKEIQNVYGSSLSSDSKVSKDAQRLWEASGATRNQDAVLDPYDGSYITKDGSPVYTGPNKFVNKSQLASSPDYKANDLEGIYKALDENYKPVVKSWEETRQDALEAGFSPGQIKKLKELNPGELSARLYRLQSAANIADMKIKELNDKLDTPEWSAKDQMEYLKVLADRNYLVTRIKGERAEYARALNVSKAASSYNNATMEEIAQKLREADSGLADLTDPTKFMTFAQSIKALMNQGNIKGAQAKMAGVNKPYWEQYLTSFHYNAMLSGLSTHVKAVQDMMTGIAHSIIDHTLAMPVGKVSNVLESLTGQQVKPGISANEVAARLYGVVRSVADHEIWLKTAEALKTGEGSTVLPNGTAIPTSYQSTYLGTKNPRLGILSKPSDLITAQDTFFRSQSVAEHLYGLGVREAEAQLKASGQPYTRDDVFILGSSIAQNPPITMLNEARAQAEKALLLNHNRLTGWIDKVKAIGPTSKPVDRLGAFIANNLAPFIRVAANSLMTRTIERSPLAILSKQTRKAIMDGGPDSHLAIARIGYGTVKLGIMWMAADAIKDKLTGSGPENPNKRKELEAAGWRPNAVHENGVYNTGGQLAMSLNPFDMHNNTAQMVASLRQAYEKGANQGQVGVGLKLALGSILHDIESETWVDSVAPAVDALTAEGSSSYKINQFVGDEAKSWVPNIVNQIGRMTNPYQVDTRAETDDIDPTNITGSIKNSVQSAIPGLNAKLPTRYSVYGNPIPTGQNLTGVHTIIPGLPGNQVKETTDPAERELNRLAKLTKAAIITPVQRTIKVNGEDRKLTSAEFQNYQRVAGRAIVETVRNEMNTPAWQAMSDQEKVLEVRSIQTDMKKAAREELFAQ